MFRYEKVAQSIISMIHQGLLKEGDRIPSLRKMSEQTGASLNTVREAYERLEQCFYIDSLPQSGYFVRPVKEELKALPARDPLSLNPEEVSFCSIFSLYQEKGNITPLTAQGIAILDPECYPSEALTKIIRDILRDQPGPALDYMIPPGYLPLREQLARIALEQGTQVSADDILITNGAHEALYLILSALCKPGDVVALESPCYFNLFHMLEKLKLKVIELPASCDRGIPLETLEFVLEHYTIKAFITVSNFSNPLGFSHSREKKQAILKILGDRKIPLIEDDLYSELHFTSQRPDSYFTLAEEGQEVILCSSFSKTLGPGLRIGWIYPGRWKDEIAAHKTLLNLGAPSLQQIALAQFLASGLYSRYLRRIRRFLAGNMNRLRTALLESLPRGSKVSNPQGGLVLWVTLPEGMDSLDLYKRALSEGLLIAPGKIFSQRRDHSSSFRLNAGFLPEDIDDLSACLARLLEDQ